MADLAVVFHWAPSVMDEMSIPDLMGWHRRAAKRSQTSEPSGKRGKR